MPMFKTPSFVILPKQVDLRMFGTPIKDQGALGACVTYTDSSALELQLKRMNAPTTIDPLKWYDATLAYEGHGRPDGVVPVNALIVGANGVQLTWKEIKVGIEGWQKSIQDIKGALASGYAVEYAFRAYKWLQNISGPLETHTMVATGDPAALNYIGGHQSLIVGYNDTLNGGSFILQNSWGTNYGDKGFYALSYTTVLDGMYASVIDGYGAKDFRYTPERVKVVELYAALFMRAPEYQGLDNWVKHLETKSADVVAQLMYDVAPARAYYPANASPEDIINSFYINVLGRKAEKAGLDHWAQQLSGKTVGDVITDIIDAVNAYNGPDPLGIASQKLFFNRCAVGAQYSIIMQAEDINTASRAFEGVTSNVETVGVAELNLQHLLGWM